MPKATKVISVGKKRYNPIDETEIDEELAPVKELAKEFQVCTRDFKEKITGAKLVEDENGKRVLLLTGFKTKEKDRSKRMVKVGGEFDSSNIVAGTRRRKNVNYKSLEEKASKPASKNSFDKRSKLTEKMNKKKAAAKKETEDKENVENQMADEDVAAEKKTTKKQKEEWTYPLSKKNFELMKKLGATIKLNLPKRAYRDEEPIPEEINAFVSAKFPEDIKFTITKKHVGGHSFGLIKHEIFILNDDDCPEWMKKNEDYVIIGEGESGIIACKKSEAKNDFKVYIIFDATEDEEEMVFTMSLSKYLSNLKRHRLVKETEEEETAQKESSAPSQEEETTTVAPSESQELVEQSLASDAALNEKVDIMED